MKLIEINRSIVPEAAYWCIKDMEKAFWLDSGMDEGRLGRYSFIGAGPTGYFKIDRSEGVSSDFDKCNIKGLDPFVSLSMWLEGKRLDARHEIPFLGGAVGYFSYDMKNLIEDLPRTAVEDIDLPLCELYHYEWTYIFDHLTERAYVGSYDDQADLKAVAGLFDDKVGVEVVDGPFIKSELTSNMSHESYIKAIESVKSYIKAGDIYQINYTQRFSAQFCSDETSLYYQLRRRNPAPFAAYLKYDGYSVLSSSPERFVKLIGDQVETRPIKGTVKRGLTLEEDDKNRKWLENSEKDHAELLMIVDLERNDLSKIAAKGSVEVPQLFQIETYPTVFHLVSTVTATLSEKKTAVDVIKAAFPGGSITGAPKIRAMQVIDELEPTARNIYTGSIGYISQNGDMDLNIVIRTILRHKEHVYYQVGGGIVWDSIPESEFEETLAKGVALKRTLYHDSSIKA
ncbi:MULTISPECIES: aminodeoxychorismate synthase component I [unclassified Fusibacter]|uniref:aminodeoxychorismate synthase component I n=1 Tax=unclassified Fusibacter TaxID=2624464 RepID=UPI001011C9A1|nr:MULTISPECIES: aminodeoxychorismate synthase component I [unclassified Fusibacter]MCK8058291.1 aminodeoxychorismate synthase component I [Fusibacter sp. A2]NPE20874.1 aminodeoxychorismate synthase component I [Fusibacter sp. A1]RXV63078.1 aminodeoxychorismate synthase component I [Fusibacter sp. A1]